MGKGQQVMELGLRMVGGTFRIYLMRPHHMPSTATAAGNRRKNSRETHIMFLWLLYSSAGEKQNKTQV